MTQVATPDELRALAAIRDLKARYRDGYGELQLARSEAEYTAGLVEVCKQELVAEFEAWWGAGSGGGGADDYGGSAGGFITTVSNDAVAAGPLHHQQQQQQQQQQQLIQAGGSTTTHVATASSRQGSAGSTTSSMLLGGLPSPSPSVLGFAPLMTPTGLRTPSSSAGALTPTAGRSAAALHPHQHRAGSSGGGVPLASIVVAAAAAEAEAVGDAGAAAYYSAQQGTWRSPGTGRPGSVKKHRAEHGTFSQTQRSAITDTAAR